MIWWWVAGYAVMGVLTTLVVLVEEFWGKPASHTLEHDEDWKAAVVGILWPVVLIVVAITAFGRGMTWLAKMIACRRRLTTAAGHDTTDIQ